jgi:hypothetical protein|tara:strand:+ start:3242 stop:3811 length:570 start_codon:yes stop_codon:yes gene_type:complete
MHNLEPYYLWRQKYIASKDPKSPFWAYQNSEVYFTDKIYDHIIHPQWDNFGAETLFMKQLYTDYEQGFTILEFMGEWNDLLHNDIMLLKRDVLEPIMWEGVNKFILIGENVLNFHASDTEYYEEWQEELDLGWVCLVNFRKHVLEEMQNYNLDQYLISGGDLDELDWPKLSPLKMFKRVNDLVGKRLSY